MGIKIMIADNQIMMREGISCLLSDEPDMEVVGEVENGRTAIELARQLQPNVVIIETCMPNFNGIEATRQMVHELPGIRIIALSERSDGHVVSEMLRAGVSGYLSKQCNFQELMLAIQEVTSNKMYLSPRIIGTLAKECVRRSDAQGISARSLLTTGNVKCSC